MKGEKKNGLARMGICGGLIAAATANAVSVNKTIANNFDAVYQIAEKNGGFKAMYKAAYKGVPKSRQIIAPVLAVAGLTNAVLASVDAYKGKAQKAPETK